MLLELIWNSESIEKYEKDLINESAFRKFYKRIYRVKYLIK